MTNSQINEYGRFTDSEFIEIISLQQVKKR